MKSFRWVLLGLLALGSGLVGCTIYSLVAPSTPGKAWVVGWAGPVITLYLCDATGGKPVCTEQKEQE